MDFIPWKKKNSGSVEAFPQNEFPRFFADLLSSRGFSDEQQAKDFIAARPVLHSPSLLADMDNAVVRIRRALSEGERILVYGDYDCDGVSATVMLYSYLESEGADVLYYIPQREEEGYGLNPGAVERIRDAHVKLVITVDNGISSIDEIALATGYGIDVIVTDHHRPKDKLPSCVAVVDPHRADCDYPFKGLCGTGVAFKLISALENDAEGILLEQYGDLLAIATVADIVPLVDENRYFVKAGLVAMGAGERVGLAALSREAGIEPGSITGEQIAFGISPRINVTGRIGSVDLAVELLLTSDEEEAEKLAKRINDLNARRKDIEARIVAEIGELLAEKPELTANRVLVVCGDGWHPGVIGITAARLVERYGKPCVILTRMENEELRGSARSVEGFSIIEAIHACSGQLIKCGGHPMAAGLSLLEENLDDFISELESYSAEHFPEMPRRYLEVDCVVSPSEITLPNVELLESLQPYGCGNPQPVLALEGVRVRSINPIGSGAHLRLTLDGAGGSVEAVYFNMTAEAFPFPIGTAVNCAVTLSVNCWQGVRKPSVKISGMEPVGFPMEAKLRGRELFDRLRRGEPMEDCADVCAFGRGDLSVTFRLLRELSPCRCGADWLLHRLGEQYGGFRLLVSLEILCELGLISTKREKNGMVYTVMPSDGKANIADAPTYKRLAVMELIRT